MFYYKGDYGMKTGKQKNFCLSAFIALAVLVCVFTACDDGSGKTKDPNGNPTLTSISAVYTQGGRTVYSTTPLDDLKTGLTVTAHYSDSTSQTVTTYTLSGTLTAGTSEITVTYQGKTAKFTVTVSGGVAPTLTSISAVYTQGGVTVYPTTPLDNLKTGLTVTAHYSNGTSQVVTAYTLSGTLTVGSSTITVTYQGQSTSFIVTVQPSASNTFTVTFNINQGSGTTPSPVTANAGQSITLPAGSGFSRSNYTFGGWNTNSSGTGTNYDAGASYTGGTATLWARWLTANDADFGPGAIISNTFNVGSSFEWNNAVYAITSGGDDKNYIIKVTADFSLAGGTTATFGSVNGIKVSLRGEGRTLTLSGTGSILWTGSNQSVILRDLTLRGNNSNTSRLVYVSDSATFTMHSGEISGNTVESSFATGGGGVYVGSSATFTMHGGKISDNTASYGGGGGVVNPHGMFIMNGGEISNNAAIISSGSYRSYGGGVYGVNSSSIIIYGGKIFGNTASEGGGVYGESIFMDGGKISGNTADYGGGVCGEFIMDGGEISDNTATNGGGGVNVLYVYGGSTMNGGKISGNTADNGGGVYGSFIMDGGEISGNNALNGGGVYTADGFDMNNGEIFGNTATNGGGVYAIGFDINNGEIFGNTATNGGGVWGFITMNNGKIYDNIADNGGGVFGSLIMKNGKISGNNAFNGGGVCTDGFDMYNGEISGNSADNGGGVYVGDATLRIAGGIIYGSNAATGLKNTATVSGAALYKDSSGTVEYGVFNGDNWNRNSTLDTRDTTIQVVGGMLQ
jgi:hypothetical protein